MSISAGHARPPPPTTALHDPPMRAAAAGVAAASDPMGVGPAGLSGGDGRRPAGQNGGVIARPELPDNAETPFRAVAAVADALYVADAAGRYAFLNPATVTILGYAGEDELPGRPSHEMIHYLRPDGSPFPAAQCPLLRPA